MMQLLALGLAIALILGFTAGRFDPREYPYIAFFGLAYPFVLLLNILMLVWWTIRSKLILAGSTLVLILIGWQALNASVGIFGEAGEGAKGDSSHIRMMTYNVHSFSPYGEKAIESAKEQMLDVIEQENPDIICFQEYFTRRKGPFDITDSLKRLLQTSHYYFVPTSENSYEGTGLAIFSKYPIKDKGHIVFGENHSGNTSIYADLDIGSQVVRVYNVHLQSISFREQDYAYIDEVKKKMNANLTPSRRILGLLKRAFIKRSHQVDVMKAHMETCQTPLIIAGDFNDTPASYAVTQLTRSLNNTFMEKGTGLGRTYNGKFPNFQIDYIAASKALEVVNYRIIPAKLSDHFPVRSDLKLNP